jgi:hypothetical protein
MHRLLLTSIGNHPRLIEELLEETALSFYEPANTEKTALLATAISRVRSAGDDTLKTPVLLVTSDCLEILEVLKQRIESCGGRARLE